MMFSPFDNAMFTIVPIFIFLVFVLVFGTIIFALISSAKQWKKNNDSPVLSVDAVVVAKRTNLSHHHHDNMHNSSSTTYYITFEVDSGDRMELKVQGTEYGILIEQDKGKLTFQGTRYLGFKRIQ
ncbi:DUF2500 domain-containing protein [Cellulosilyticum sp. WCF-2]|uniref:DUF2500 domain-containing protein n=1 Tax=Cellulosilyticum sp. WCF-2 TaxID=2497860 RepID=UPI000F8DAC5F|nr:DUF2500 domain-containing protein [Cellulosilyticum sp. WCF-2]QEH70043.1 DUF2500 domain-containing protein [Cellulosilyticum sp. WCF-2]